MKQYISMTWPAVHVVKVDTQCGTLAAVPELVRSIGMGTFDTI
jgi:hypothetical protein